MALPGCQFRRGEITYSSQRPRRDVRAVRDERGRTFYFVAAFAGRARRGVKAAGSPQSIIILVTIKNVQTRRRRALASRRESASELAASLCHQSCSYCRHARAFVPR